MDSEKLISLVHAGNALWDQRSSQYHSRDLICNKRSRGFGFITYSSSNMVDEAMANRPHCIDKRQVEAKRAVPRAEIGNPEAGACVTKLFVGGIKDSIGERDLKEYFSSYGNVLAASMPVNKETGNPRGFAFIEFDDYDSVDKVILNRRHVINGKSVEVKKALPKDAMDKSGSGGGRRGGGRGGDDGRWNNRSASQDNWGGNGYGGSPWSQQADQGWGNQQGWGAQGSGGYGSNQPWAAHQPQGNSSGGPMRNNYTSGNRIAPYGTGATNGYSGGYGSGGGGRRF